MYHPTHGGRATTAEPADAAHVAALPPSHHSSGRHDRARPRCHTRGASRPCLLLIVMALMALLVSGGGCGGTSGAADEGSSDEPRELMVFAAASLTEAFGRIGHDFTAAHPEVEIVFNFAGSNDLVTQLQAGAPVDVLATADTVNMDAAGDLVDEPGLFAANELVIAVAPGNPKGIAGLADLSRRDVKLVLAAPEVPAGKYAAEILSRAGVEADPVSLEVTVKGVASKVALGEADAGIVFVTDVRAAGADLDGVPIPTRDNVIGHYPLAVVTASTHPDDAAAFVDFVLSTRGQEILADHGFLPAP